MNKITEYILNGQAVALGLNDEKIKALEIKYKAPVCDLLRGIDKVGVMIDFISAAIVDGSQGYKENTAKAICNDISEKAESIKGVKRYILSLYRSYGYTAKVTVGDIAALCTLYGFLKAERENTGGKNNG